MGTTEVQAAAEAEGLEITEIMEFDVAKVSAARSPANGTPILFMKALAPATGAGRLEPPTQDGFTGPYGGAAAPAPAPGVGCGCCANCTCPPPAAKEAAPDAGWWVYPAGEMIKDHREFSSADRKKNASAGNALPDGSYPIPDADALGRAAVLARSKHGDWKAAKRLIAKRAKELGVPNPLDDGDADDKTPASKSVAEGGTTVDTGAQDEQIAKLVSAEVAKALKPHEEREQTLGAELAKANAKIAEFAAMPREGGPLLRAMPPQGTDGVKKAGLLAKAEEAEELARTLSDPDRAAANAKLAAQYRAEAAKA